MNRILIIGGGDLAKQINHHLTDVPTLKVVGFVDDTIPTGEIKFNRVCMGPLKEIPLLFNKNIFDELILAIGYKHLKFRQELLNDLSGYSFHSFIHSNAFLDNSAVIGKGVFISPGVVIDQNVIIEDNVFIYNSVTIAHDSVIRSNCFISPSCAIAGFVTIGSNCNLGISTTVIDHLNITNDVQTGAGTIVTKNIGKSGLYVGNPARFIK